MIRFVVTFDWPEEKSLAPAPKNESLPTADSPASGDGGGGGGDDDDEEEDEDDED